MKINELSEGTVENMREARLKKLKIQITKDLQDSQEHFTNGNRDFKSAKKLIESNSFKQSSDSDMNEVTTHRPKGWCFFSL